MQVATNGGGTITDRVVCDDALPGSQCAISATKVETTLPDFESSVLNASQKVGVKASDFGQFVHETTVMINVLLSRHGIDTGLPTTAGFRDGQGTVRDYKPNLFNMILTDVCSSVPHRRCSEIHGKFHTTLVNQGQGVLNTA